MTDRLIRIKTVIDMTGISRSGIYAAIAKGCFPKSIQLSTRSVAWAESSINTWIQDKINPPKPKPKSKNELYLEFLNKDVIKTPEQIIMERALRVEDI